MTTDPLKDLALKLRAEFPDAHVMDVVMAVLDEAFADGLLTEGEFDLAVPTIQGYLERNRGNSLAAGDGPGSYTALTGGDLSEEERLHILEEGE